jgi:acyclic terpene utilization AtuA family protein
MTSKQGKDTLRIGCGAGYSGDRIEPAIELATRGDLDYLIFECLAERTIAIAQQAKAKNPASGYDPLLVERMEAVLPACLERGTRIITNMGAANPGAAAARVAQLARARGWRGLTIAAVTGDDVLEQLSDSRHNMLETGQPVSTLGPRLISANAYIGAAPIVEALARGANLIITGRVADPALFLAAQAAAFEWSFDDWRLLGRGTMIGHLLECAGQVTGGYFADSESQPVEGLARLGFPIAEVREDGTAVVTKVPGSGGLVSGATCKLQLLYEVHDPAAYVTPDVVADFSQVRITDLGHDRVMVTGGDGRPRPDQLKVSVAYKDGYIGEGQISYAGPGAAGRARLALEIVADRLRLTGVACDELRCDLIGVNALHAAGSAARPVEPYEVRARVTGRVASASDAVRIGNEVESLYTNGPSGGGGATKSVREVLAIGTTFVPRELVRCLVQYEEVV